MYVKDQSMIGHMQVKCPHWYTNSQAPSPSILKENCTRFRQYSE